MKVNRDCQVLEDHKIKDFQPETNKLWVSFLVISTHFQISLSEKLQWRHSKKSLSFGFNKVKAVLI